MRNLKRALSLTLASVMLLGMMVVGSSAKGYDDVTEDNNVEAIEVLQTIEVMVGDERGFGPDRPVNRAEMAVVMGKLLSLDYNYYATSCPFNDVYDWARGYVGACYANKIVSGRGDGVYDPGATVTAVEAASMLMRALGYFQYANDVADGFELSTVRQGTIIGIFDGVGSSATEPMTRNQVAQMVLNALKSAVVEPDGNTINLTTPDGTVLTGKVNYVSVTSRKDFAYAISSVGATSIGSQNDGAIVELGERLYNGELKLHDFQVDEFGRPSRQWEYKGTDIGTYEKKELLRKEYTTKVTGKDLYDLLTKSTIEDYAFRLHIDGEEDKAVLDQGTGDPYFNKNNLIRTNTKAVGATDKGVLTRVYVDTTVGRETIYVAIINTYLAKATDDYNENKEEAYFDVYGVDNILNSNNSIQLVKNTTRPATSATNIENLTVKQEDIDVSEVKDGDFYLVHVAEGEIKEIIAPETVESEINSFKTTSWVNAEGTQYDYDSTALYDPDVLDQFDDNNMKNTSYRIFLDEYGYLIGLEIIEEPDQYVFLTGIDGKTSNLSKKTAEGNIIHLDGTMETVEIDMDKSLKVNDGSATKWSKWAADDLTGTMNTWCKYTVNAKGVYTLTEIADTTDSYKTNKNKTGQGRNFDNDPAASDEIVTLDKSHITLNGIQDKTASPMKRVYGNDNSIFLVADVEQVRASNVASNPGNAGDAVIIDDVDSVTTGVRNVNLVAYSAQKVKAEGSDTLAPFGVTNAVDISSGVYTLFNDKGFVIAAVVVGEDEGTTSSYAFVHTGDAKREDYNKDADEWTWYRDVIVNGEVVTLTEKGGSNPKIRTMSKGQWYEIKYNAAGEVRNVIDMTTAAGNVLSTDAASIEYMPSGGRLPARDFREFDPYTTNSKYIAEMNDASTATDNKNTVLLWQDLNDQKYSVSVKGNALKFDNKTGFDIERGIDLHPDAKTVLIQDEKVDRNNYPSAMENVWTYTGGGSGAEKAIKHLENNSYFRGYVGAVFENGLATSIILWDRTPSFVNTGAGGNGGGGGGNGQLPNYSEVPVNTANMALSASLGRYADGKLYIQFNGLNPDATKVTIKNLAVREIPSGYTHYLDDIEITKDVGVEFYVYNTALSLREETNSLTVTGGAQTVDKITVDNSLIKMGTETYSVTGDTEIAASATTYKVTVAKPTGANTWSLTWKDGTDGSSVNVSAATHKAAGAATATAFTSNAAATFTADSVELEFTRTGNTTVSKADVTVAVTEWNYTLSTANATLGADALAVAPDGTNPASLTNNTAETIKVSVVTKVAPKTTDKVVVEYTVDNVAQTAVTANGDGTSQTTAVSLANITALTTKSIVITSVKVQRSFAAVTDDTGTSTNLTAAATWTLYKDAACTQAVATTDFFDIGATVYVKVTGGTLDTGKAVTFAVTGGSTSTVEYTQAVADGDGVVLTYTIAAGATAPAIAVTANDVP